MAHSKYYYEFDRNRSIDDATPAEWNHAAKVAYDRDKDRQLDLIDDDPLIDFNPRVEYKYSEDRLINELQLYVDQTYGEHYSKNKYQATEFIIDAGHGMSFCLGNVLKYSQRYGHKDGHNRKDLMKVLHYALIALHCHDTEHGNSTR